MTQRDRIQSAYRDQGPHLLSWLNRQVGDRASDLLHDIVVRALTNLDSLEPVRDLTAWLWRSARNRVIDLWRGEARDEDADWEALVDSAWEADSQLEDDELLQALAEAISRLPEPQREVIVAQGLNGETFAELAQRTGVSADTWAARKRYAVAKIRRDLGEFYSGGL